MGSPRPRRPRYNMVAATAILLSSFLPVFLVSGQDVASVSQSMSQLRGQQRREDPKQQHPQGKRILKGAMGPARAYYDDDDNYVYPTSKGKSSDGYDDDGVDIAGGGQNVGRQGGYPVRCIVHGRPVDTVSVSRRRPVIRDRTQPGFARVQRRSGVFDENLDENNRARQLQRTQGGGGEVFWPSVESEEDCFFGVFSINSARVTRPPRPTEQPVFSPASTPTVSAPTVVPVLGAQTQAVVLTPTISSSPSVSNSPTAPPSLSSQPSLSSVPSQTPTTIVRNLQFDSVNRTVQTTLNFGFFFGTNVRTPNDAELTGILEQIDNFFTKIMSTSVYNPTFTELQIKLVSSSFDPTQVPASENEADKYPVSLVMTFAFLFLDSSAITSVQVPTEDQLIALIQNADYLQFIENYAWVATPANGLFFETQVVQYGVVSV